MLAAYRSRCADPDVRFLAALDWCTDGTAEIVAAHADEDPRVQMFRYPKLGKGGVIMETFRHCDGDLIGFVDADCATPPLELMRLVDSIDEADGAIATRRHPAPVGAHPPGGLDGRGRRGDCAPPPSRRCASRPAAAVARDGQCGVRLRDPAALPAAL